MLSILSAEGFVFVDHRTGRRFGDPGPLESEGVLDPAKAFPIEFLEQQVLGSAAAETSFMANNVMLLMQAIGLGGWLYSGINTFTVLGAFAAQGLPGYGFRFTTDPRWPTANPVGLDDLFETLAPPYVENLTDAAEIFAARKFGPGGTYDPSRPGPFRANADVKASIEHPTPELVAYVGSVAQDVFDTYGRFPGTIPTIWAGVLTQAHHADADFYERFYDDGALLETHRRHFERWHGGERPERRAPLQAATDRPA